MATFHLVHLIHIVSRETETLIVFAVWRVKNKTFYVETNYSWALSKIRFYLKRSAAFKIDLKACVPACRFSISWIWWTAILRSSDGRKLGCVCWRESGCRYRNTWWSNQVRSAPWGQMMYVPWNAEVPRMVWTPEPKSSSYLICENIPL